MNSSIVADSPFSSALAEKTLSSLKSLAVPNGARVLVAVSGGPDSLALAHVLQSLRGSEAFAEMAVAHVNHGLRAESEIEENMVRQYCEEWNVPIHGKHADTLTQAHRNKTGIEEMARKIRYQFFAELVEEHGFDFVLTAHTANDQAETVLMHLMRGAGVRGLAGIPPKRKLDSAFLLRPWLSVTRNEILEYIQEFHLAPMHDASNDELSFQRNRVRHKVMPVLSEAWPNREPVRALASLAERMRELSDILDGVATKKLAELREGDGLSLDAVRELPGFEFHAVMELWVAERAGHYMLSSQETERIQRWLTSGARALQLRRGVRLRKQKRVIEIKVIE